MSDRGFLAIIAACAVLAGPGIARAQQSPSPRGDLFAPKKGSFDQRFETEELTPGQIQRAQDVEPPEGAPKAAPKAAAPKPAQSAHSVSCSGAFAKDSNHVKLTGVFKAANVAFNEVDAGEGRTVMASVLFPKDPKQRLEVWWLNEQERAGLYLVVINGQSTWTAPKGMRLGLTLAAVEKLNGKPFKVRGLNSASTGMISDWQGGALENLPGGCRFGISYKADAKSNPEALAAVSGDAEFASTEKSIRAVKPTISEILIGY